MDYGERFNYGKIKDDFDSPKYPKHNGYYSSTHTSFDSKFNQIPSLEDLEEEYPNKFKTFRWGKDNQFFATYGIGKFGELELLDTNWHETSSIGDKELKEENDKLKKYIDYLKEKNDALKSKVLEIKKIKEKQKLSTNFIKFFLISFLIIQIFIIFMELVNFTMLNMVNILIIP